MGEGWELCVDGDGVRETWGSNNQLERGGIGLLSRGLRLVTGSSTLYNNHHRHRTPLSPPLG